MKKQLIFSGTLKLNSNEEKIAHGIIKEILARLQFLIDVGLDYLTIERNQLLFWRRIAANSPGHSNWLRLSGVVYILDEPSVGLHQRDMGRLINTLKELRDLGNTVIVVEHDEQTMRSADWLIDVGPGAGEHGGKIIFEGTFKEF